jgi:hypothetical protein
MRGRSVAPAIAVVPRYTAATSHQHVADGPLYPEKLM